MKTFITSLLNLLIVLSSLAQNPINSHDFDQKTFYPVRDRMLIESLNGSWQFKLIKGLEVPDKLDGWITYDYDDSNWDVINVPSNWETEGFKIPEYRYTEEHLGLYRTSFKYNKAWNTKHVILRFDGVLFGYEVFVNGQKVGQWGSSFNMAQFDITDFLKQKGENLLCVKVTTRTKGWEFDKNDCWTIAGIFRDVEVFPIEDIYLEDITFNSDVTKNLDANISLKVDINHFSELKKNFRLNVSISDPLNNHLLDFQTGVDISKKSYNFEGFIKKPKLWTAETPNLYRLEVTIVNDNGYVIQRATEQIGIRSIAVEGFDLKINHSPILLRGVCVNEIDPILGRALTYEERYKQLVQMKKANINFIRTAHYPFGPDFLELCNQLGFYVADEIPFGHGDQFLEDTSYLPELIARAQSTIKRDKNHPSVIIWTIGNENPYTGVVEDVIKFVKKEDPSRPRGLPQRAPTFGSLTNSNRQSDNVDIYMGHYLNDIRMGDLVKYSIKPVIMTEYAHSLGLSFDELENRYKAILTEPKIIGGAIWDWNDQAILTNGITTKQSENQLGADDGAFTLPYTSRVTQGVWIDSLRYLDSFGNQGTDGIVYANGFPQEDFFQVRKVYSPIVVLTDSLNVNTSAPASLKVEIENRFDFITLNGYSIDWEIKNINKILFSGKKWLEIAPRSIQQIEIPINNFDAVDYSDLQLVLYISNNSGYTIYEKSIPLSLNNHRPDYSETINALPVQRKVSSKADNNQVTFKTENLKYSISGNGILKIKDSQDKLLINSPIYLRVGRKVTVTPEYHAEKNQYFWNPYILSPVIEKFEASKFKDSLKVKLTAKWMREDAENQYFKGTVEVIFHPNGVAHIHYQINPSEEAKGYLLECGITFKTDESFDVFRWLGQGPYTSTPGKNAFNERGIWALHKEDIRFIGNRGKVDIATLTAENIAIGLWSKNGNLGVENIDGSVYITQNTIVMGYGSKFTEPKGRKSIADINQLNGSLLIFIDQPKSPAAFLDLIFKPYKQVVPEKPFYDSYGW